MPVLTGAQFQNITDRIVAQYSKQLENAQNVMLANTTQSLMDQLLTIGGDDLINALGWAADLVDQSAYPENLWSLTYQKAGTTQSATGVGKQVLNMTPYREFAGGLSTFVKAAWGGSNASLAAAFKTQSARIHPVFGELMMLALGNTSVLTTDDESVSRCESVFAPAHDVVTPDAFYVGVWDTDHWTWTDDTTDATDVGAADVPFFVNDDDAIALGFRRKVDAITAALSTLGSHNATCTYYYSTGAGNYATASGTDLDDDTAGFTVSNIVTFPNGLDGWEATNLDPQGDAFDSSANYGELYWIVIQRTAATLTTPPVGTIFYGIPQPVLVGSASSRQCGLVTQPPLAIIQVTAQNTCSLITSLTNDPELTYFDYPEKLQLKALALPGTPAAATFTLGFTDDDGDAATQAQSAWAAPVVGDSHPSGSYLSLGSSAGTQGIIATGLAVTTTMATGVFAVTNALERTPAL